MGNNNSKGTGSNPSSTTTSPTNTHADANALTRRTSRRRESFQGLPTSRVTAAPPTASLESAQGESVKQPSQSRPTNAQGSRTRSSASTTPNLKAQDLEPLSQVSSAAASFRSAAVPIRSRSPIDPIDIPAPTSGQPYPTSPHSASPSQYQVTHSHFGRPPRLPLPIQEEVLVHGSPIISPSDVTPINRDNVAGDLPRGASVLSSTTGEEDEVGDDMHPNDVTQGPQVEMLFEWKRDGDRVYVTGTFAGWNRKYRLHRNGPGPNPKYLSARIPLPPGTHHIKFIVDGNMRISEDMPSAVDYTNVLVNWIEVSEHKPSAPRDIPQPRQVKQVAAEHRIPHVAPSSGSPGGTHVRTATPTTAVPILASPKPSPRSRPPTAKKADPSKVWHSKIPPFLADLDEAEDSSEFQRANQAMSAQPVPPTLPMFLNKSIMNSGGLPVKDDSSVLVIPNHTVLNHLATSSIKNNVLATSATTRYDGKYVTTILYKPTSDTGE